MDILLGILAGILAVVVGYILGRLSILPNHVIAERLKSKIKVITETKGVFHSPLEKQKADQLKKELEEG